MDDFRKRLEADLMATVSRLRVMAKPDELEELPASIGSIFDDADKIQVDQAREFGLMTKARLVERANRLAAALQRLDDGEYGTCLECGEAIALARLRALPEVQTCVPCQDRLERAARFSQNAWLERAA